MNGETQANRLAYLMQQKSYIPSYELALPLVTVRSSSFKNINVDDVLLLGLHSLVCELLDNAEVCANVVLVKHNNRHMLKIVENSSAREKKYDNKKYEIAKLSFGMIQSRTLSVGHTIDMAQVNLEKLNLVLKNKKIATASLVSVDSAIAVQIDKVKNEANNVRI